MIDSFLNFDALNHCIQGGLVKRRAWKLSGFLVDKKTCKRYFERGKKKFKEKYKIQQKYVFNININYNVQLSCGILNYMMLFKTRN